MADCFAERTVLVLKQRLQVAKSISFLEPNERASLRAGSALAASSRHDTGEWWSSRPPLLVLWSGGVVGPPRISLQTPVPGQP